MCANAGTDLFSLVDGGGSREQFGQLLEHLRLHLFDFRKLDLELDEQVALIELCANTRMRLHAGICTQRLVMTCTVHSSAGSRVAGARHDRQHT